MTSDTTRISPVMLCLNVETNVLLKKNAAPLRILSSKKPSLAICSYGLGSKN